MAEQAPLKETPPEGATDLTELSDDEVAKVVGGQLPKETAYQKILPPNGRPTPPPQFPRWPADANTGGGVPVDPAAK